MSRVDCIGCSRQPSGLVCMKEDAANKEINTDVFHYVEMPVPIHTHAPTFQQTLLVSSDWPECLQPPRFKACTDNRGCLVTSLPWTR